MPDPQNTTCDYEKLGSFYLGRTHDLAGGNTRQELVLYDSRDLVTHAVCFGMTGSGKTGLCLSLLEEAAIDGIPAIAIDPKGDLTNLLLGFPDLRPADFEPWVQESEAQRVGLTAQAFAAKQADLWRTGLAKWGQDGERIRRMQQTADFTIYTPGSDAGVPVSVLKSFSAPDRKILEDREFLRDRVSATATSLLALLGIEADPVQSREHILLSTLFENAWKQGQNLELGTLIQQIQSPPVSRVGVLDLESFYPAKERFSLAMMLNNLLASPSFESWMEGEALDVQNMLRTPQGKPRISIFSIAHLNDSERMFFVSLLLNQTLSWMRQQPGTTSLRAILYMDEIFGYFPPVANPPSKGPLLTLLKQARAFGLGIVLATQNPVDLDYKGLSNAGTWFIGRLQTDRDRARVLDGLAGSATASGVPFDRQAAERTLAGLGNRVFLLYNAHEDAPEVFETRWALSYLAGPLTRTQIKTLMAGRKAVPAVREAAASPVSAAAPVGPPATAPIGESTARPVLPPEVRQYFLPARGREPEGGRLTYQPVLVGSAKVRFTDTKTGVDVTRDVAYQTEIRDEAVPVNWEEAQPMDLDLSGLENEPRDGASFGELPAPAGKPKNYAGWSKDFVNWVYANEKLELFRSGVMGETSQPGEPERDFRVRLDQAAREQRDQQIEALRQKYAPKVNALQDRLRRAQQALEREKAQAQEQTIQTVISVGTTLLGAFLGRKAISTTTLTRAGSAARAYTRSRKESQEVDSAGESIDDLQQQLAARDAEFQSEKAKLAVTIDPVNEKLDTVAIRPKKANISVKLISLTWLPFWQDAQGTLTGASE